MAFAPQHDWQFYNERTRDCEEQWQRGQSSDARFVLYCDLFNVILNARQQQGVNEQFERLELEQKIALRLRMVDAFTKLDQRRREQSTANHQTDRSNRGGS